jgi:hypothetical protein
MADQLQYELGQGPCVTAVDGRNACAAQWLRDDSRWPAFGRRVSDEVGFASLLSFHVALHLPDVSAALNVYSDRAGVFDHQSVEIGQLMADTARTLLRGRVTAWPTSNGWTSTDSEPPSTPPGPGS